MPTHTYRCVECLDHEVARSFDVSHLRLRCGSCGAFSRFVQSAVIDRYERFEADPPEELDWDRLSRIEKFLVAERVTRTDRTIEDFDVEEIE